jgi:hypothetical protein
LNGAAANGTIDPSFFTLQSAAFSAFNNVSLTANFGSLSLTFTPVPEPGTTLGLAAVVLGLGALVRRASRRDPAAV